MAVAAEEDIVRAICTDKWDGARAAPSLFTGQNVSVSRLAITPLSEHWDIFRSHWKSRPSAGSNGSAKSMLVAFSGSARITKIQLI